MNKVKGIKKLNKAVTKQLSPFGITKAECGAEYAYYFTKQKVTFSLVETDSDIAYREFVAERFGYTPENDFIFSLLHEIGHHKANDNITDDVYQFCLDEKARIEKEIKTATTEREKELNWQYFNLPDEIMATQWAVKYAEAHPKKVRKMWKKCEKAIHKFYAKNLD